MRQVHLIALLVSLVFAFPVSELWRWLQTADQVGELWSSPGGPAREQGPTTQLPEWDARTQDLKDDPGFELQS